MLCNVSRNQFCNESNFLILLFNFDFLVGCGYWLLFYFQLGRSFTLTPCLISIEFWSSQVNNRGDINSLIAKESFAGSSRVVPLIK